MSDPTLQSSHENEVKRCIECQVELPFLAERCPQCRQSQTKWKNRLSYWASVSGFLTAILAVTGYLAANFEQIRSTLFWNDELIVTRADIGSIEFLNVGDGRVFALNFAVVIDEVGYEYFPVWEYPMGKMLNPGESFVVDIPTDDFFGCSDDTWLTNTEYGALSQNGHGSAFLSDYLPMYTIPIASQGEETTLFTRMESEYRPASYLSTLHTSPTGARIKYISFKTGKTIFQPLDLTTTWVGVECVQ